jgi:topoisomerase-4 subunit A
MQLDDNEKLVQALAISAAGVVLVGTGRGGKATEDLMAGAVLAPQIGKRARKGRAPDSKLKVVTGMRPVLPQ